MGCFQSGGTQLVSLGGRTSSYWNLGEDDASLTEDDIKRVTDTWSLLRTQGTNTDVALIMFEKLFEKCHSAKVAFEFAGKFEHPDGADCKSDPKFRAHIREVVIALDNIVDLLDNPETLQAYMYSIRDVHERTKEVQVEHFEVVFQCFQNTLIQILGSSMKKDNRDSWRKFLRLLAGGITPRMDVTTTPV